MFTVAEKESKLQEAEALVSAFGGDTEVKDSEVEAAACVEDNLIEKVDGVPADDKDQNAPDGCCKGAFGLLDFFGVSGGGEPLKTGGQNHNKYCEPEQASNYFKEVGDDYIL